MLSVPVMFLACSHAPPPASFVDLPRPAVPAHRAALETRRGAAPFHELLTAPGPPPQWFRVPDDGGPVPSLDELARLAPRRDGVGLRIHVDPLCLPR